MGKRMEYLVTAKEMRRYDENTSGHFGVPSIVLMERAALACLDILLRREKKLCKVWAKAQRKESPDMTAKYRASRRVLVLAGTGNNGGDGFALGRLLMQEGFAVDFVLAGDAQKATGQTLLQMETVQNYGAKIRGNLPEGEYDIIIDALFGVGLTRPVDGFCRECVEYINESKAFVLSVDMPSGIHADNGHVMGTAVHADVTVTFGFRKLGLVLYPGAAYAGQLHCAAIGITKESFLGDPPGAFTFSGNVAQWMPERSRSGNKGTFGKVALLAGSVEMAGAALLAGKGAFACGCGMVKIVGPEQNRPILNQALPEAMVTDDICEAAGWADVLAAGPGLGTQEEALRQLAFIIEETRQPLVLDADAINLLSQKRELLEKLVLRQQKEESWRPLVLTPHPGELARLCGCRVAEVLEDPAALVRKWAGNLRAVMLCKGAGTCVASPGGKLYVNCSGNSGMATAGSGDVLTGIVASLAAQGKEAFCAACAGVYLHGLAGDLAARKKSTYGMKAGDIVKMIPRVLQGTGKGKP